MGAIGLVHDLIEPQLVLRIELSASHICIALFKERPALRALTVEVIAVPDEIDVCAIEEEENGV